MNKTAPDLLTDQRRLFVQCYLFGCAVLCSVFPAVADEEHQVFNRYLAPVTHNLSKSGVAREPSASRVTVNTIINTISADDNRPGVKLNIGFDLTENVAIAAGYMDLNDVTLEGQSRVVDNGVFESQIDNSLTSSADGFTLSSIYHYSINQNFDLIGSIGVFSWDSDFSAATATLGIQGTTDGGNSGNSGTDFYFGVGGGYQLFDDVVLSVEWEHYQLDSEETQVWSIGVDYHFK